MNWLRGLGPAPISLFSLIILFYLLWRVATLYPKWENVGTEATLSWDVFGYYLYLPAQFIYNDLDSLQFVSEIFPKYLPAGDFHHAVDAGSGNKVMKYPIGMAILYLPFFLLGHLAASLTSFPVDGFSLPYQMAISWGSIVYAFLGLALLRKILLTYFSDLAVALTLAVLVLATNYLNYVSFDGAMPHNYLFTLYACILLLTIQWHNRQQGMHAFLLGLCIGWATIIRPTELMTILIPLLWGIKDKKSLYKKWKLILTHWQHILLLATGMFLMGMIQIVYWKLYAGHWFFYSYGEFGFDWLSPHIIDGLFSAKKGWLVYTPVMVFALLGFRPLYLRYREMFWALLLFFVLTVYVVFSWEVWWYGGSFGARPLVQSYTLLSIPLALMIQELMGMWSTRWKVVAFGSMLLCVDLNLIQTWQAHLHDQVWYVEGPTRKYYWKIFGKTRFNKDDKKFLDIPYEYDYSGKEKLQLLYYQNFETDSTFTRVKEPAYKGQYAMVLNGENQFSPAFTLPLSSIDLSNKPWLRLSAKTQYNLMEPTEWKLCQFVSEIWNGEELKNRFHIKLQRLSDPKKWHSSYYEFPLFQNANEGDILRVYFWNATSQKEIFIDDWKVELIVPN